MGEKATPRVAYCRTCDSTVKNDARVGPPGSALVAAGAYDVQMFCEVQEHAAMQLKKSFDLLVGMRPAAMLEPDRALFRRSLGCA
jgi:hypothetical protein